MSNYVCCDTFAKCISSVLYAGKKDKIGVIEDEDETYFFSDRLKHYAECIVREMCFSEGKGLNDKEINYKIYEIFEFFFRFALKNNEYCTIPDGVSLETFFACIASVCDYAKGQNDFSFCILIENYAIKFVKNIWYCESEKLLRVLFVFSTPKFMKSVFERVRAQDYDCDYLTIIFFLEQLSKIPKKNLCNRNEKDVLEHFETSVDFFPRWVYELAIALNSTDQFVCDIARSQITRITRMTRRQYARVICGAKSVNPRKGKYLDDNSVRLLNFFGKYLGLKKFIGNSVLRYVAYPQL